MIKSASYSQNGVDVIAEIEGRGMVHVRAANDIVLLDTWVAEGNVIAPFTIDDVRAATSVDRGVFCKALFTAGILPEAVVPDVARGAFPDEFQAALVGMNAEQVVDAKLEWIDAKAINRVNPLFLRLLDFYGDANGLDAVGKAALGDQIFGIEP